MSSQTSSQTSLQPPQDNNHYNTSKKSENNKIEKLLHSSFDIIVDFFEKVPRPLLEIIHHYAQSHILEIVTNSFVCEIEGTVSRHIRDIRLPFDEIPIPDRTHIDLQHPGANHWISSIFYSIDLNLLHPLYIVVESWCGRGSGEKIILMSNSCPDIFPSIRPYGSFTTCYFLESISLNNHDQKSYENFIYTARKLVWKNSWLDSLNL